MTTEPQITPETRTAVRSETMGDEEAGQRVDRVLARLLPGVPHTRLFRLLRRGEVRLNGKRVSGEARIKAGDVLRVPPVRLEPPPSVAPGSMPRVSNALVDKLNAAVLFENERLLVIDKPAGIAVHGGSGISAGVIEALRSARPDEPLELVHRLDRDTSGCLMIARRRSTLRSMHAWRACCARMHSTSATWCWCAASGNWARSSLMRRCALTCAWAVNAR
jgi:23S rRNA pseudouridine955/2504/2580 synthase